MPILATFAVPHPPLIVEEVGKGTEKVVEKTIESYKKISEEIEKLKPETIIISSPHTVYFKNNFYVSNKKNMSGSFNNFGAEEVSFEEEIDQELAHEIMSVAKQKNMEIYPVNDNVELDHGTMVPLYFIRKRYINCKIIVIGLSEMPLQKHYEFGQIIDKAIHNKNRKVVFVASGDLSHKLKEDGPYGFIKEGPIYDEKIQKTLTSANFKELLEYDSDLLNKAAECGHPSFTIMAGVLDKTPVKAKFYSYEDKTGVGYGIWSYYPKDEYVELARNTINSYIKYNKKIEVPNNMSDELKEKAGVFVSIHKNKDLRGCIGTFLPIKENIAQEIIDNAISAAKKDPRFNPIREEELDELEINVDVLTNPETIISKEELNPKKYGIIVQNGFRRGLLLPDLEGVDTVEQQISIAKRKANIDEDEEVTIQKFEVVRHK